MTKRVLFDASLHLGQFCLSSDEVRFGCKTSQANLSRKGEDECVGLWTDNENGRVDNAIWSLPREVQDTFYPFMDRFYSMKQINQVPLERQDVESAIKFLDQHSDISFQSAYTCAVALRIGAAEIHSLYKDLHSESIVQFMRSKNVLIQKPSEVDERSFPEPELEATYQDALSHFKKAHVDVLDFLNDDRNSFSKKN